MLTVGSPTFQKASRPPQDHTMVVACLAEVAQDMGPPISSYIEVIIRKILFCFRSDQVSFEESLDLFSVLYACVQRVMPLALKELASSDGTNRRNAAFCVGELCRNGGVAALKYP